MAADLGPVVQRLRLTEELTRLRREAGKVQEEVARALDWSTSKLIRIEGGAVGISTTDLQALVRYLGVADEAEIDRLTEIGRGTRERGWWQAYPVEDPQFRTFLGYESGASFVRAFQNNLVPALMQTMDYARVILREFLGDVGDDQIGTMAELRIRRQDHLAERDPRPYQFYILDEAVIRRQVGATLKMGKQIMPTQLRQIAEISDRPNVTVEVIPFEVGAHFGMKGPFHLLELESDLGEVLFLENSRSGDLTVTGRDPLLTTYREAFEGLREWTLDPEGSRDLILRAADEMSVA
jgi:transcriptional regulator with XRE-family HTH domain